MHKNDKTFKTVALFLEIVALFLEIVALFLEIVALFLEIVALFLEIVALFLKTVCKNQYQFANTGKLVEYVIKAQCAGALMNKKQTQKGIK